MDVDTPVSVQGSVRFAAIRVRRPSSNPGLRSGNKSARSSLFSQLPRRNTDHKSRISTYFAYFGPANHSNVFTFTGDVVSFAYLRTYPPQIVNSRILEIRESSNTVHNQSNSALIGWALVSKKIERASGHGHR